MTATRRRSAPRVTTPKPREKRNAEVRARVAELVTSIAAQSEAREIQNGSSGKNRSRANAEPSTGGWSEDRIESPETISAVARVWPQFAPGRDSR